MSWATFRADLVLSKTLSEIDQGRDLTIEGYVADIPVLTRERQRFDFIVSRMSSNETGETTPHQKFRLSWYRYEEVVEAGQNWRFTVRVKRPNGFMNPEGFDYERFLFQQGINARGYIKQGTRLEGVKNSLISGINRWRYDLYRKINQSTGEINPIIPALGLGIKQDLDKEMHQILSRTGTSHLVAISGLHISLVAGLAYFMGRWLWALPVITLRRLPASKAGAISAIFAAGVYAALAGFAIPTQRAWIMVASFMLCFIFNQKVSRVDTFFIALFAVLLFNPMNVLSIGFWLSFAAVAIIFYVMAGRTAESGFWPKILRIHFVLALGLSPLLLLFFGQSPLLGPFVNILAVPLIGVLITPMVLVALLLFTIFEPAGMALLELADYFLDRVWMFLSWAAELPIAQFSGVVLSNTVLACCLLAVALLLLPRGMPGRWLGCLFLLPMFFNQSKIPEKGDYELTLLDVGQGLAAVVRTHSHTLLFDTGAKFNSGFNTGEAVLLPFLSARGIDELDRVVISHGDNDHRGSYETLAEGIPIHETLTSVPEQLRHTNGDNLNIKHCERGQRWGWDGVSFSVLYPDPESRLSGNNRSCVIRIDNGFHSVLITGDIEAPAEQILLEQSKSELNSDILIVPHHGSKTSSTHEFIEAVSPEYALFPVGFANRYGFPDGSVVNRYETAQARLLDTASSGAITIYVDSKIKKPDKYRQSHGHFWQRNHVE